MTRTPFIATIFFCTLCITACGSKSKQTSVEFSSVASDTVLVVDTAITLKPVYAKGYSVRYFSGNVRLVDICDPQKESSNIFHYALVSKGANPFGIPDNYTVVETPVRRVMCMTSLQLSNFICLNACDYVVGITSIRHLFNREMNERLKSGETAKIGIEGNFDNEVIMSMNPDVIFISPFKRGGYDAMREIGIPLVPHLGYKEMTPLGQAEWIKFIGMFIGKEAEANAKFATIEKRYNELKELAANVKKRPVVFSGEIRGGNWYAVGGKSFLAQLFRDAGADYFLKDDPRSGGVTLDFETVYSQAENADFWRIVNSYDGSFSYDALKSLDPRYADFRAFREKGVVYCNMCEKPFYESMPMEPEIVLEDLIHAFHPDLLPDYKPTYYERLK
ncbi:ABC transporter substrate-binding protein [Bacteroides helcogenes]|uniref:Periplasmic binding protein n=1 Tax=Bacteroides helcogenes (strain ATCC 35417 / DSM 20613 / JCM 6297 / CCUG 15421 / P 36-108) TaxID=693979 RepID=E6SSU6_BACT6|nr:ABC transporter substrate-binding protein [Bacteroides helcogenes]ADV44177.1 periplasmic binding protein [Bacteroides helcogenes P 36-108]MDY5238410.1 ABC transporter substrate-binding protein [Bacteroides helcogenes]